MELIAAALGSDLNLGATEASILGIIASGDDFYAINGIFRRCDDCSSTPDSARSADTVNRNAVVFILPATGQNLRTVFRGKNACVAAGSPGALCAGKILTPTTTSLGPIAEDTRRQLEQLEDIAPERRHMLNFVAGDGAGD